MLMMVYIALFSVCMTLVWAFTDIEVYHNTEELAETFCKFTPLLLAWILYPIVIISDIEDPC